MQGENPVSLAIGTQVSAKYKGAFCEAKVRSVIKEVKCRITFKGGLGSCTLSDEAIKPIDDQPIVQGVTVKAKHPDKQEYLDAIINQIKDQSKYTVTFNDGDIAQLRRNALRLKSGKHFNPSESLDNLPLTHPEHFSTPVGGSKTPGGGGGRRRNRSGAVSERSGQGGSKDRNKDGGDTTDAEKDNDYESEGESENDSAEGTRREGSGPISSAYMPNIGRVVWAENTDKKSKGKETNWFPALVVAPTACDIPTDTKEDFLIRSFKDGRYYTVAKKETNKFDKDNTSKFTKDGNIRDALQKALSYIEKDELPPHWDKEIIFAMDEPTTSTESSESASERSEDGDDDDDSEDDEQTTEEKDHLVAELYKHMEDKGSPINHTPAINGKDVDLYRLYRVVDRLGGHTRVTNKNLWKQVGRKLGFENTWSTNQVRTYYNRYLKSFEELNRTLGCTLVMDSISRRCIQSENVKRVQVRGKYRTASALTTDDHCRNSPRSSLPDTNPSERTNAISNAVNLKASSSQLSSQILIDLIQTKTPNIYEPSTNLTTNLVCTPSIRKQKSVAEISESPSTNAKNYVQKENLPSYSISSMPLNIVSENILTTKMSNETNKDNKQRRNLTKESITEIFGFDSDSKTKKEDLEADGDVDSNDDDIYSENRVRQKLHRLRKKYNSRTESRTDNKSTFPSSTGSSAPSNCNSPIKLNKTSPSIEGKPFLTTSITIKPLTDIRCYQSSSVAKKQQERDATSETSESDYELWGKRIALPSQSGTKLGISTLEKAIQHRNEAQNNQDGEQDVLDLASGDILQSSTIHSKQSDIPNSTIDQYLNYITKQRSSASGAIINEIDTIQTSENLAPKPDVEIIVSPSNLLPRPSSPNCLVYSTPDCNSTSREAPFSNVPEPVLDSDMNSPETFSFETLSPGTNVTSGHIHAHQVLNGYPVSTISSNANLKHDTRSEPDSDVESLQGYSSASQSTPHGNYSAANISSKSSRIEQGDHQGDYVELGEENANGSGAGSDADSATWPGVSASDIKVRRETSEELVSFVHENARKKRSRNASTSDSGALQGRKRRGSSNYGNCMTPSMGDPESDENEEGGREIRQNANSRKSKRLSPLESLDNDALAALSEKVSKESSTFNFCVNFDPTMDSSERISKIENNIEELRKTYKVLRSKLTAIEKRRRKLRRRDRERSDNLGASEAEAIDE